MAVEESQQTFYCLDCLDTGMILATGEKLPRATSETYGKVSPLFPHTTRFKYCKCENKRNNLKRIHNSGLEETINNLTFDTYKTFSNKTIDIKKLAVEYISQEQYKFFFIGGKSGTGKTHICTAICKNMMDKNKNVIYISCIELLAELKSLANDRSYEAEILKYKNIDVLYIDDMFKGHTTQADVKHMFILIDYRYRKSLITIISSEMNINQICEIDQAIGGRIGERASQFVYDTNGMDNYRFKR